ncbi:MAG: polyphosphate kinase 2 family protein [Terriglobales bacterium]|jgi:PPK2 family polyphosphate:nucleotide phosphotransferase
MKIDKMLKKYRVESGKHFRLKDYDPADTHGLDSESKDEAQKLLADGVEKLSELQDVLAAQDRWGLLIILQAMDAAGKDGTIKHVMSGVNPQGVDVTSFKVPTAEEMSHGYLWRTSQHAPARGRIGIFNRSYYEEVLVVRVHPEVLANEKLPNALVTNDIWEERYEDISNFERYVTRNGIAVVKFFLNVSKKEQKRRFLERLETPDKNWKFSTADLRERGFWDDYQAAYEEAIRATATKYAPWYVIPADHKWFTRLVVAQVLVDELKALKLEYPKVSGEQKKALAEARKRLDKE